MTLRWKVFERSMRSRIGSELRASSTLWKEFRQARKRGRTMIYNRPWAKRLFFLLMASLFVAAGRSVMFFAALIAAWTICAVFFRAAQLHGSLHGWPGLQSYYFLPIPDKDVFRVQWRQFLRTSLWSAVDFAVLYFLLVLKLGGRWNSIEAGIGLGLVQWLIVPMASLLVMFLLPAKVLFNAFWMLPALTFGFLWLGPEHEALFHQIAAWACWIPPMGSIFQILGVVAPGGFLVKVWPCLVGITLLAASSVVWQMARRSYAMPDNPLGDPKAGAEQFRKSAGEAQETIRSRKFITGLDSRTQNIVERGLFRLLTPREKVIAEFMTAGTPKWAAGLKTFAIVLTAATLCFWVLAGVLHVDIHPFVLIWPCIFFGTKLVGGWRGFAVPKGAGIQPPAYAGYPVGFWELGRAIMKIDLARLLIALPFVCCAFAILQQVLPDADIAAPVVFKLLACCFMFFPLLPIILISSGTNDTQRARFVSIIAAILILLVLIGGGVTLFVVSSWKWIIISVAAVLGASALGLFLYARSYNLSRFDLIPVPQGKPI